MTMTREDQQLILDAAQAALARDRLRVVLKALGFSVDDLTDDDLDAAVRLIQRKGE
jgi:hypothetical protein